MAYIFIGAKITLILMTEQSQVIKLAATPELLKILEQLKKEMKAGSNAEVLRRVLAKEMVIRERLNEVNSLIIKGKKKGGGDVEAVFA